MKKLLLLLLVLLLVPGVLAFTDGLGDGSAESPFKINSCERLDEIRNNLSAHYVLVSNVDCTLTYSWNGDAGWVPIGAFAGVLDGQGFNVSYLYSNVIGGWSHGFMNSLSEGGVVRNIGFLNLNLIQSGGSIVGQLGVVSNNYGLIDNVFVRGSISGTTEYGAGGISGYNYQMGVISNSDVAVNINGYRRVGGVVGDNWGVVVNTSSESVISGDEHVGGLVGFNRVWLNTGGTLNNRGRIFMSVSRSVVSGNNNVGGVAGSNTGYVLNSYSLSNVSTSNPSGYVGGFLGFNPNYAYGGVNYYGSIVESYSASTVEGAAKRCFGRGYSAMDSYQAIIRDNYCDYELAEFNDSTAGANFVLAAPKSSEEMIFLHHPLAFLNWDFISTWGATDVFNSGYPFLLWEGVENKVIFGCMDSFAVNYNRDAVIEDGSCFFPVYDCYDLQDIAFDLDYEEGVFPKNFVLMNDVDCSVSQEWSDVYGDGFFPIYDFEGIFDGDRKVIKNLFINRPDYNSEFPPSGLFGNILTNGVVRDVGLVNVNITGWRWVGGLAGSNLGLVERTFSSGFVTGTFGDIAGLVGDNGGNVYQSYSVATVVGGSGLVSTHYNVHPNQIRYSYFRGVLPNGGSAVGTILLAPVHDSYMAGEVFDIGGGFAGSSTGALRAVFYDSNISGVGEGISLTTEEMSDPLSYYSGDHWFTPWYWDFDTIWGLEEGVNGGYPYLRWQEGCTDPVASNYESFASVEDGSCEYAPSGGGGWPEEEVIEEPVFVIPTPEGGFDLMVFFERLFSGEYFKKLVEDAKVYWLEILLVVGVFGLIIHASMRKNKKKGGRKIKRR